MHCLDLSGFCTVKLGSSKDSNGVEIILSNLGLWNYVSFFMFFFFELQLQCRADLFGIDKWYSLRTRLNRSNHWFRGGPWKFKPRGQRFATAGRVATTSRWAAGTMAQFIYAIPYLIHQDPNWVEWISAIVCFLGCGCQWDWLCWQGCPLFAAAVRALSHTGCRCQCQLTSWRNACSSSRGPGVVPGSWPHLCPPPIPSLSP